MARDHGIEIDANNFLQGIIRYSMVFLSLLFHHTLQEIKGGVSYTR